MLYEESKFSPQHATFSAEELSGTIKQGQTDPEPKTTEPQEKTLASPVSELDTEQGITNGTAVKINPLIPQKTYRQRLAIVTTSSGSFHTFARHCYQPLWIMVTIPAVFYMSLVYGVVLGT